MSKPSGHNAAPSTHLFLYLLLSACLCASTDCCLCHPSSASVTAMERPSPVKRHTTHAQCAWPKICPQTSLMSCVIVSAAHCSSSDHCFSACGCRAEEAQHPTPQPSAPRRHRPLTAVAGGMRCQSISLFPSRPAGHERRGRSSRDASRLWCRD